MDDFEFQDPQFISASPTILNLSIQIATEFISFAVQEKQGNKLLYLRHINYEPLNSWHLFAERLEKIFESQKDLTQDFSSVKMMWISDKYTLVPTEYSDELYLKKLFQLVHPIEELDELNLKPLPGSGYNLLFSLPQEIVQELKTHWPKMNFYHQLLPLHSIYKNTATIPANFSVFLQVYPGFSDIIVYKEGLLKLANSFPQSEKSDLVYNLLNIFNHFEVDPATGSLLITDHYFHGLTGQDSLKKYFQHITFEKPSIPVGSHSLFQMLDLARYVNLLNLINCE